MKDDNGRDIYSEDFRDRRRSRVPGKKEYNLDPVRASNGDRRAQVRERRSREREAARYTRTIKKSLTTGPTRKRYGTKRRKPQDDFFKKAVSTFASIALVGAIGYPALKRGSIVEGINHLYYDNPTMERILEDYDVIVSQAITGRTADNTAPVYDYQQIAEYIINSGNIDEGLYGAYEAFEHRAEMGDYNVIGPDGDGFVDTDNSLSYASREMNNLIRYINEYYGMDENLSWDDHLRARNFKDEDDWKRYVRKLISEKNDINELQSDMYERGNDVSQMMENHQYIDEDSIGGKSL